MKRIVIIVGTRPNFIKVTQFKKHSKRYGFETILLHTGQHYDHDMAKVFFEQFDLNPDIILELKANSQLARVGEMITALEIQFDDLKPDAVLVCGDVDSTMAGAVVAKRMGLYLGHIESGLRSFDRTMPEELNRIMVDDLSDILFVTEESGLKNLDREGKPSDRVEMVGNTMIDTLIAYGDKIEKDNVLLNLAVDPKSYILVTMHRPNNVDQAESLNLIGRILSELAESVTIVLPMHPRTKKRIADLQLTGLFKHDNMHIVEPQGYFAFQKLIKYSKLVLTDSGGIQEETTFLGVPCITVRPNTERPITIDIGTNVLMDLNRIEILERVKACLNGDLPEGKTPPLWDGKATERILERLQSRLNS